MKLTQSGSSRYSFIKSIRDSKGNLKGIIVKKVKQGKAIKASEKKRNKTK